MNKNSSDEQKKVHINKTIVQMKQKNSSNKQQNSSNEQKKIVQKTKTISNENARLAQKLS